jgi:hypothetical protein
MSRATAARDIDHVPFNVTQTCSRQGSGRRTLGKRKLSCPEVSTLALACVGNSDWSQVGHGLIVTSQH